MPVFPSARNCRRRRESLLVPPSAGPRQFVIVVVVTDAPLLPHQLKAVAKRASLGVGRVGGLGETTSGDIFLASSTANAAAVKSETQTPQLTVLANEQVVNQIHEATVQATEEASVNALIAAETMTGLNGTTVEALPHRPLQDALRKYGRLNGPAWQAGWEGDRRYAGKGP